MHCLPNVKQLDKKTFLFLQFPRMVQASVVMLLLYLVILIWDQLGWWTADEEYHFGFLVPLFVGFVLSERWPVIRSILEDGGDPQQVIEEVKAVQLSPVIDRYRWGKSVISGVFSLMTLGGMLIFLLGGVIRLAEGGLSVPSTVLFSLSFSCIALGLPYLFFDKDVQGREIPAYLRLTLVSLLLFPALVWLVASPLPGFIKQELKLFLLDKVVTVVYFCFELFGYPLIKKGNTFVLPEGQVGVADACSGIRSLTGCVVTGVFLAAVSFKRFLPKLVLVMAAILLAIVSNIARSLFLTVYAYRNGGDSISGFVHDVTGYAVLGVTAVCLWGIVWVMSLGRRDWSKYFEEDNESYSKT